MVVRGRSIGRVGGTPQRRWPAWPSQFGDVEASVPASGSNRGWPLGQAETVENLASDREIFDSGKNTHPAAAAWTFQHIHGENSRHQLGPAVIARMRSGTDFPTLHADGPASSHSHERWIHRHWRNAARMVPALGILH